MIASVRIQTWNEKWKALGQNLEKYAALRAAIPGLPAEWKEHQYASLIVDDDGMRALASEGLTIEFSEVDQPTGTMLVKLQDSIQRLGAKVEDLAALCRDHCVVQIAIPDIGLMLVEEVEVVDDACTDRIQSKLDEGWRILAVCPPNAQRRPDYVLGRRKVR